MNHPERRIVTVEDPVENKLTGVMQIAVKTEIGLTFATALRSILRADPNIVMIGEIRDLETAEIAIRASLTGHLVFSTLHTNDAMGGISRLVDMGVEPFLVSAAVRAFLAQRLVRKLCPHCKVPREVTRSGQAAISASRCDIPGQVYSPKGCDRCRGTGFSGRLAIYEVILLTPPMQELVAHRAQRRETARASRPRRLRPDARPTAGTRSCKGETTIEEVISVTSSDIGGTIEVIDIVMLQHSSHQPFFRYSNITPPHHACPSSPTKPSPPTVPSPPVKSTPPTARRRCGCSIARGLQPVNLKETAASAAAAKKPQRQRAKAEENPHARPRPARPTPRKRRFPRARSS